MSLQQLAETILFGVIMFFVIWYGFAKAYPGGRIGANLVGFVLAFIFILAYGAISQS